MITTKSHTFKHLFNRTLKLNTLVYPKRSIIYTNLKDYDRKEYDPYMKQKKLSEVILGEDIYDPVKYHEHYI